MNISSISPRRWAALLLTVLLMLSLTPAALADTDLRRFLYRFHFRLWERD